MVSRFMTRSADSYESRYRDLVALIEQAEGDCVLIDNPQLLGHSFTDIVESLNRLAEARKHLIIAPLNERQSPCA